MEQLNDIFDEDLGLDEVQDVQKEIQEETEPLKTGDDIFTEANAVVLEGQTTILDEFLTANGVKDSTVKILNEKDEEEEVSFNSLSKEDQLDILNSFRTIEKQEVRETSDNEFIKELEKNNLTVEEFLQKYKEEITEELSSSTEASYDIDAYDNEELFILDLKTKYGLSDEELIAELEKEKGNEELFKKKTDALRTQYKELEDQYKETQKTSFEKEQKDNYDEFAETMVDIAVKNPEFHGIELEDNEKNEVLSYLLDLDEEGNSMFYKELNSPEKLYEAAWFLRYGKGAFDALKDAYEQEISKIKKDTVKNEPLKKVIIKDNRNKTTNINDLTF